jgi:prophage DNA circulation protein
MSSIIELSSIAQSIGQPGTIWRDQLMPATFAGQQFHCEANSREGGQRIVTHQFPKRDLPYSETMGRHAMEFTVRGYTIVYPSDSGAAQSPLYQRDYRVPRDNLINALDAGNPAILQLPTQAPMWVCCTRYRMNEEERFGGYCTFDMTFVEYGKTQNIQPNVGVALVQAAQSLATQATNAMAQGTALPGQGGIGHA